METFLIVFQAFSILYQSLHAGILRIIQHTSSLHKTDENSNIEKTEIWNLNKEEDSSNWYIFSESEITYL